MENNKYSIVFTTSGMFTVANLFHGNHEVTNGWGTGFDKQEAIQQLRSRRSRVRLARNDYSCVDDVFDSQEFLG